MHAATASASPAPRRLGLFTSADDDKNWTRTGLYRLKSDQQPRSLESSLWSSGFTVDTVAASLFT